MRSCIIHIGMHKTGTTSIQQSLHRFADKRFFYANLGGVCNHSLAIFSIFADKPESHHLHKVSKRDRAGVARYISEMKSDLEESIDNAADRTLLISGEDIGMLSIAALNKLKSYFAKHFEEISIVGYVRAPAAYISSGFQEKVKGGVTRGFDVAKEYRNYQKSFDKFDTVFGKENVHLWKFAPEIFPGGCVVSDFCQRLQIELPANRIVRSNESLSRPLVALFFTYGKYAAQFGFERMAGAESQRMARTLSAENDLKFRFSPDILRPILEDNHKDIQWMETRLGQPLTESLGSHQNGDVSCDEDLLTVEPNLVGRILSQLGDNAPAGIAGDSLDEVVLLVQALREKVRSEMSTARPVKAGSRKKQIDISVMLRQIRQSKPDLFEDISLHQGEALLADVFLYIKSTLSAMDQGLEIVPRLGRFRVKKQESDGKSTTGRKAPRQIIFQTAATKAPRKSQQKRRDGSSPAKGRSSGRNKK